MTSLAPPVAVAAPPGLLVEGVTKEYPARLGRSALLAVDGVSFAVQPGEILALLGPNGAGKTTTIKMIAGLLRPTRGRITVAGVDVDHERSRAVRHLGAVLEGNRNLHWKLTTRENLRYFGALKGAAGLEARIQELIDQLALGPHLTKRVGELSRGLQQRVAIAIALVNRPRILLLDEPTLGLDVVAAHAFKDTIRAIAREGCGIILTTHQMEVAQALAERVAIIAQGRLAVMQSLEELMRAYRVPGYLVRVRGILSPALQQELAGHDARDVQVTGDQTTFAIPEGDPAGLHGALGVLARDGIELLSVQQQEVNLEEIYRRVVEGRA